METVTEIFATLGEGPSWDENRQILHWMDIKEQRIYEYKPSDGSVQSFQLPQLAGAAVPKQGGGYIVAMQHGLYSYAQASGQLGFIHDPESSQPDNRFNDGKCDPMGRFWAGTLSMNGKRANCGLYRLDSDWSVTRMLDGIHLSNGLGWSPDGTLMYHVDTLARTITAYEYDMETGELGTKRSVIEVPKQEGLPDGMTVDEEGNLWVAHWDGHQVTRWNSANGELLERIAVPAPQVTSCVFGGPGRNELYITTAKTGMSDEALRQYPLSGGLFKIRLDVCGALSYSFAG